MEAWAARPAPCDPRVGADQRPGTISACCPAASAGLPVVTSFPCGGGPGCPHDQAPATSSPKAASASRSLAAPVNGRAPEPATEGRSGAKLVTELSALPDPGASPRAPGIPEVPVDDPGVPSAPVPPDEVVPGGGAMIPPVLVSVPVSTPMSTPIPVSVPGLVPVPVSMPRCRCQRRRRRWCWGQRCRWSGRRRRWCWGRDWWWCRSWRRRRRGGRRCCRRRSPGRWPTRRRGWLRPGCRRACRRPGWHRRCRRPGRRPARRSRPPAGRCRSRPRPHRGHRRCCRTPSPGPTGEMLPTPA